MRLRIRPALVTPDLVDEADAHAMRRGEASRASVSFCGSHDAHLCERELRVDSTPRILGGRDRFQVVGIHAARHAAEVVDPEFVGNRPVYLLVHQSMSAAGSSAPTNRGIAAASLGAFRNGYPARRLVAAVFNGVVGVGEDAARVAMNVTSRVSGWFTATTDTKGYAFHCRLLTRGGRGASRADLCVAPFYILNAP